MTNKLQEQLIKKYLRRFNLHSMQDIEQKTLSRICRYSRTHLFQKRSARNWTCFNFLLNGSAFSKTPEGGQTDFLCIRKSTGVSGCGSLGSFELAVRALSFSTLLTSVKRVWRTGSVITCVPRIAFNTVLALHTKPYKPLTYFRR